MSNLNIARNVRFLSPFHYSQPCSQHQLIWSFGRNVLTSVVGIITFNNYSVEVTSGGYFQLRYPTLATDTEVNSCFSIF